MNRVYELSSVRPCPSAAQLSRHRKPPTPSATTPTPVFIYGTLCAMPLLAWALTGDASNVAIAKSMCQPARVRGYARRSVLGKDHPAVVPDSSEVVEGYVVTFRNESERGKLDDFEGDLYKVVQVQAEVGCLDGKVEFKEADMYIWSGDMDIVLDEPWDLVKFVSERLKDWLGLFKGMELTGGD